MEQRYTRKMTKQLAFCGLMAGLGTLVMLTGGLIPVLTYCSPLAAAALLLPVLLEYGKKPALLVWLATALLALAIGADKEAAFFYIFLGWYPVLKPRLDALHRPLRLPVKLTVFLLSIGLMYYLLLSVFTLNAVVSDFADFSGAMTVAFLVILAFVMLLYDMVLARLALLYVKKLRPKI